MGEITSHAWLHLRSSVLAMVKLSPFGLLFLVVVVPILGPLVAVLLESTGAVTLGPFVTDARVYESVDLETGGAGALARWVSQPERLGFGPSGNAGALALAEAVCTQLGVNFAATQLFADADAARDRGFALQTSDVPLEAAVVFFDNSTDAADAGFLLLHRPGALTDVGGSDYEAALGRNRVSEEEGAVVQGLAWLQLVASRAVMAAQGVGASGADEVGFQRLPDAAFSVSNVGGNFTYVLAFLAVLGQGAVISAAAAQVERKVRRQLMLHGERTEAFVLAWFGTALLRGLVASSLAVTTGYAAGLFTPAFAPVGLVLGTFFCYMAAQAAYVVLVVSVLGKRASSTAATLWSVLSQILLLGGWALVQVFLIDPELVFGEEKEPADAGVVVATFLVHTNAMGAFIWALASAEAEQVDVRDIGLGSAGAGAAAGMLLLDAALYLLIAFFLDAWHWDGTWLFFSSAARKAQAQLGQGGTGKPLAISVKGLEKRFKVAREAAVDDGEGEDAALFSSDNAMADQTDMVERRLTGGEYYGMLFGFPPRNRLVPAEAVDKRGYAKASFLKAAKAEKKARKRAKEAHLEKACCGQVVLRAVDGIDMDVEANQVFCLLGQNGAGKTTALSMLTGAMRPNAGEVWVNGLPIHLQQTLMRQQVGLCPQHDVNMDHLTCLAQLTLYGLFHGLSREAADAEALELLDRLGIADKAHALPGTLSGGQLRRLSFAGAVMGRPPVLFLDECSTGLDPANRRRIWELIRELKRDHTIVLTTHSMEEAEALGDRIAIMSKGKMQAQGTLGELRQLYGPWYHLSCARAASGSPGGDGNADGNGDGAYDHGPLFDLVKEHVPDAELLRSIGPKVGFNLPLESKASFPALLDAVDRRKAEFGIASISVSPSTLDDIFIRLAAEQKQEDDAIAMAQRVAPALASSSAMDLDAGAADALADVDVDEDEDVDVDVDVDVAVAPKERAGSGSGSESGSLQQGAFSLRPTFRRQLRTLTVQILRTMRRRPATLSTFIATPLLYAVLGGALTLLPSFVGEPGFSELDQSSFTTVFDSEPLPASTSLIPYFAVFPAVDADFDAALGGFSGGNQSTPVGLGVAVASTFAAGGVGAVSVSEASFRGIVVYNDVIAASARTVLHTVLNGLATNVAGQPGFAVTYEAWADPLNERSGDTASGLHFPAMAAGIMTASVAAEMARLKKSRFDQVLLLSGLSPTVFWATNLLIYASCLFVGQVIMFLALFGFGLEAARDTSFAVFLPPMLLVSLASALLAFAVSLVVTNPDKADQLLPTGMVFLVLAPWALSLYAIGEVNVYFDSIATILVPPYGIFVTYALLQASALNETPLSLADVFGDADYGYTYTLLALAISCAFYSAVLLASSPSFKKVRCRRGLAVGPDADAVDGGGGGDAGARARARAGKDGAEDSVEQNVRDVAAGVLPRPVAALPGAEETGEVLLDGQHLSKRFGRLQAARDVTFATTRGAIFGLLGPNGCGKSTTMNCISHLEGYGPDSGDALVVGESVVTSLGAARKHLGVCPQFDAHVQMLSGRELLRDMCNIRGVPEDKVERLVESYIDALDLRPKADSRCGTYSGGNRRRLSIGMSLMANPEVVLLDEPTTGIDPASRRAVWDFLLGNTAASARSVVLTTHSMEEAETLCSRVAIMAAGSIRAHGTPAELKARYGEGIVLRLTLNGDCPDERAGEIARDLHPGAELAEQDGRRHKFIVPATSKELSWSVIFSKLQGEPDIEDFTVAERSLADVFVKLASLRQT